MAKLKKNKEAIEPNNESAENNKDDVEHVNDDALEEKKESVKSKKNGLNHSSPDAKAKAFQLLQDGVNKESECSLIQPWEDTIIDGTHFFSTGSFWLDYAVGFGIPRGRFIMFWGTESSMKSTLSYKICADAQSRNRLTGEYIDLKKIGETHYYDVKSRMWINSKNKKDVIETNVVAIIDVEATLDHDWASANGLDCNSIVYSVPEYGEQAVDLVETLIRSTIADVILIDSLAMFTPIKEIENSSEKASMGTERAVLINKACRKWTSAMNSIKEPNKRPLVIMIQQLRQKAGVMFGSPDTRSGGLGQGFITSIEIKTKQGKTTFLDEDKKYPLWVEMTGEINKNKCAPPKIPYSFDVAVNDYDPAGQENPKYPIPFKKGDILEHKSVMDYASKLGLVGKRDNKYYISIPSKDIEQIYDKRKDLLDEWFYFDRQKYSMVKTEILKKLTGRKDV